MKRISAVVAAVAVVLAAGAAQAQAKYKWRMTTLAPSETSTYFTLFAKPYAENVKRLSNGEIEITPHAAGVIAPAFKAYEAVQDGLAELANSWSGYLVNQDPANALLGSFPGGMGIDAYMTWLYAGGGMKLWQDFRREKMGLHTLVVGVGPAEIHLHSNKPVRTVEDLKGMKIRTAGAFADVVKALGGSPVTVPGSEVYTMLERKAVDAVEWATPAENMVLGLHKAAKYVIMPGVHAPTTGAFDMVMKPELWDGLPDRLKTAMETAAQITTQQALYEWTVRDMEAMEALRKGGNEIIVVDPSYIQAIDKASRDWAYEKAKDNPWVKKIADSFFGFKDRWAVLSNWVSTNEMQ